MQEVKDSSEIENSITTHDDLYKTKLNLGGLHSLDAKEVQNYISALKMGYSLISKRNILITNDIIQIQSEFKKNNAGFRKVLGTELKNAKTGKKVYTPPQVFEILKDIMSNLEQFINDNT